MEKQGKKTNRLIKILLYATGIYLVLMVGVLQLQKKIIFQPEVLPTGFPFSFPYKFEELNFTTNDGASLNALYFTVPNPKGAILYFHGNKGSLKRWGNIAGKFTTYGYNVLVMDYRGYGKSKGEVNELNLQNDARLFYKELLHRFTEDSIIVYGRSLGTHFATLVASENKPQQLILETPFTSITDVAQGKFLILPVKALIEFPFDNTATIKKVSCPLTIFHGTADGVVPYRLGKKLFDEATSVNKKLITVPHGSHNNLIDYSEYNTGIKKILNVEKPE